MDWRLLDIDFAIAEEPGLGVLDPRFVDIAGMIQDANFSGAAQQAQEIIEEEIYDIRIICYFLYGVFNEQGPNALNGVFIILSGVLTRNWDAVGPTKNKEKQAKNSLNWFFKQINKTLENQEKKKEAEWERWLEQTSSDEIYQALDSAGQLKRHLPMALEDNASVALDQLAWTTGWMDSFYRLIYQEEAEPEEPKSEESEADDDDDTEEQGFNPGDEFEAPEDDREQSLDNGSEHIPQGAQFSPGQGGTLKSGQGSYLLQLLLRKMALFERLIKEDKNAGAALVAQDINRILADFDPQIYFPEIFSGFAGVYALNIEKILPFKECKSSAVWQAVEKFYHVDMDSFAKMDNGFHDKEPEDFVAQESGMDSGDQKFDDDGYDDADSDYDDDEDDY